MILATRRACRSACELHELLVGRRAERGDQDASLAELREERGGEGRGGGGDQDAVEWGLLGPAERAVADPVADVRQAQAVEHAPRPERERREPLDREDLGGQLAQDGRLVAAAGADLEDALDAGQGQLERSSRRR